MPHLIWSGRALADLQRLDDFLALQNPAAALRARVTIIEALKQLETFPSLGRPARVARRAYRDFLIRFGDSGYVVRYEPRKDDVVLVVAIRHMRETKFGA
jgi:plasmid stabilization system protein ParE